MAYGSLKTWQEYGNHSLSFPSQTRMHESRIAGPLVEQRINLHLKTSCMFSYALYRIFSKAVKTFINAYFGVNIGK